MILLRCFLQWLKFNIFFEKQDTTNLKYANNYFDVVIIANALHVIPTPEMVLVEIKRVLKPNAVLIARSKLKILSPFDNLLIQRKRIDKLFNFEYVIECYVPEAKRKFGYFSLSILWDGKLVARMDCRVDRTKYLLHIHHLALEPGLVKMDDNRVDIYLE